MAEAADSQPSPANNQTLVGIETATTASNAIREDFWVDNGDLVLEVEQHRFKILRADLSCSEVFKDMFDLSDMPVPEEECVDGVPLVRLAHDKARDWMVLLWWLYDFEEFKRQMRSFNFNLIAGALRIAAKYEVSVLRDWAAPFLGDMWPDDLSKLNSPSITHGAGLIDLARTVDIPILARKLPIAFYALSAAPKYELTEALRLLEPADQARVHAGIVSLNNLARQVADTPLSPILTALEARGGVHSHNGNPWGFCGRCRDTLTWVWRQHCMQAIMDRTRTQISSAAAPSLALAFMRAASRHDVDKTGICGQCALANEALASERLHELRRRLVVLFEL